MKTKKTPLIVATTIITLVLIFSIYTSVVQNASHQNDKDLRNAVYEKLNSAAKADSVKTVYSTIHITDNSTSVPIFSGLNNNPNDLVGNLGEGDKVIILDIAAYHKKVKVRSNYGKGWVVYYYISEFKDIAVNDPDLKK
jgi:hypothetical protein